MRQTAGEQLRKKMVVAVKFLRLLLVALAGWFSYRPTLVAMVKKM